MHRLQNTVILKGLRLRVGSIPIVIATNAKTTKQVACHATVS
ncbi:hypothetical protein PORCAN_945 [Porphyromonas crevioricanis JCM 13913]|nr:hypothetical protein PORCAN_945 [Porphyromonas crevioricanis JCM 13913]